MTIIITIMLITGLIFFAGGSIGIIRFPDFYSRLHPAGKLDTAGLVITMSALALYTIQPLSLSAVFTSAKGLNQYLYIEKHHSLLYSSWCLYLSRAPPPFIPSLMLVSGQV